MLTLEVGKYYKNRIGDIVKILARRPRETSLDFFVKFRGDNEFLFYEDGKFLHSRRDHWVDLVVEISEAEVSLYQASLYHPEIPTDDIWIDNFYRNGQLPRRMSQIGPHEYREFNLMIAGLKPCAFIPRSVWGDTCVELCKKHSLTYELSDTGEAYVAVQGEEWRIITLQCLFRSAKLLKNRSRTSIDIAIGRLFGYRQIDIDVFIERSKLLHQYTSALEKDLEEGIKRRRKDTTKDIQKTCS